MRTTLNWAAPALLLAIAAGCGHEPAPTSKAPSTPSTPTAPATPAGDAMVTLKVDGMT